MEPTDLQVLADMHATIVSYRSGNLGIGALADRMLALRDRLQFRDHVWSHELTQQIATLDSASTFVPRDSEQGRQLSDAIGTATSALLRLIDEKLV